MARTLDTEELEVRLIDSVERYRNLSDQTAAALVDRDKLVVMLTDQAGYPRGAVAELAGISRAQVHRILCNADEATWDVEDLPWRDDTAATVDADGWDGSPRPVVD